MWILIQFELLGSDARDEHSLKGGSVSRAGYYVYEIAIHPVIYGKASPLREAVRGNSTSAVHAIPF